MKGKTTQITFIFEQSNSIHKGPESYIIIILLTYNSMYVNFKTNSQIILLDFHSAPITVNISGVILNKWCYY